MHQVKKCVRVHTAQLVLYPWWVFRWVEWRRFRLPPNLLICICPNQLRVLFLYYRRQMKCGHENMNRNAQIARFVSMQARLMQCLTLSLPSFFTSPYSRPGIFLCLFGGNFRLVMHFDSLHDMPKIHLT